MKKIISLFQRNYDGDRLVRNEVVPGAEWVLAGEGVATRKYDGTCCMVRNGKLYKRHEVRVKNPPGTGAVQTQTGASWVYLTNLPAGFEPATEVNPVTLKQQGWVPVGDGPEDQWHREAWEYLAFVELVDGTYELVGPKVQNNPDGFKMHTLVFHDLAEDLDDCPRDFDGIKSYLAERDIEGIVWHHQDGRMAKIKKKDFGLKRKPHA